MAYYIYSEHVPSGRQAFVNIKDTMEEAVKHIARCYASDAKHCAAGEYYYYLAKR